jgi:hypothetical protein
MRRVADGGDFLSFARVGLATSTWLDPGPLGCIGVGTPFGIAASLACPDRIVYVATGDGAFGFNAMEIDTAARHRAPVLIVVANNGAWQIEVHDQQQTFGKVVGTRPAVRRPLPPWRALSGCMPSASRARRTSTPQSGARWRTGRRCWTCRVARGRLVGREDRSSPGCPTCQALARGTTRSGAGATHEGRLPASHASRSAARTTSRPAPPSSAGCARGRPRAVAVRDAARGWRDHHRRAHALVRRARERPHRRRHPRTTIGDDVTVGRFGLVHACSVGDGCVVGEAAAILDGAASGPYAVIAADSVVTPRKQLPGGWLYAGAPAKPVREITLR